MSVSIPSEYGQLSPHRNEHSATADVTGSFVHDSSTDGINKPRWTDEAIQKTHSKLPRDIFTFEKGTQFQLKGDIHTVKSIFHGKNTDGSAYQCRTQGANGDPYNFGHRDLMLGGVVPAYQMVTATVKTATNPPILQPINIPCQESNSQSPSRMTVCLTHKQVITDMLALKVSPLASPAEIAQTLGMSTVLKTSEGESYGSVINYVLSGRHQPSDKEAAHPNLSRQFQNVILRNILPTYA